MADIIEYKCPCCGGAISFDSKLQKMKCPYCDTEFEMDALKAYDKELKNDTGDDMAWDTGTAGGEWGSGETEGMHVYTCKSCGGEIVADESTAAASCPFCGNPVVMTGQFAGALRPDMVIPFKLDKKAAKEGLKKHLEGKLLLPRVFKSENHIDEIKGVYVPFWLFDTEAQADIRYKGTKIRTWRDKKYRYTQTSYFALARSGEIGFEKIPVDGSSKIANDMTESLEPYRFQDAVDFQTAYLAGYLADKYDTTAEESIERANERVKRSTEEAFRDTVKGYTAVIPEYTGIHLEGGRTRYALLPVWLLSTTWRGKTYLFAMNGQTGKFVGDLPMDKGIFHKWLWGLTAALSAVTYAVVWLIHCL